MSAAHGEVGCILNPGERVVICRCGEHLAGEDYEAALEALAEHVAAARHAPRGPRPVATYDGKTYSCRAWSTVVPDFDAMTRTEALFWLLRNTTPKNVNNRRPAPNLRGYLAGGGRLNS